MRHEAAQGAWSTAVRAAGSHSASGGKISGRDDAAHTWKDARVRTLNDEPVIYVGRSPNAAIG